MISATALDRSHAATLYAKYEEKKRIERLDAVKHVYDEATSEFGFDFHKLHTGDILVMRGRHWYV